MQPPYTFEPEMTRNRGPVKRPVLAISAILAFLFLGAVLASPAMADWTINYAVNPGSGSGGLLSGAGQTDVTTITETKPNGQSNSPVTAAAKPGYIFSHWSQIRTDTDPDQDIGNYASAAYYVGPIVDDSTWLITANFTPTTLYTLSIDGSPTVTEAAGTVTFRVNVSPAIVAGEWVSVQIRTWSSSAYASGRDFNAGDIPDQTSTGKTYTFAPGQTFIDVPITIVDDAVVEGSELFWFDCLNATSSAGTTVTPSGLFYKSATITDNDTATVSIAKKSDGVEGGSNAVFTASTPAVLEMPVTVTFSTVADTAVSPGDYAAVTAQTVTVGTGAAYNSPLTGASRDVTVTVNDDARVERPTESFGATIAAGTKSTVGTGSATATIADNDTAAFTIADVSANEDGGNMTFTVTLNNPVEGGVQVDYATVDGTATVADGDYTPVTGTLTFNAGIAGETETITVTPAADDKIEADETFTLVLSNPTPLVFGVPASAINASDTATGTILNDDAAILTMVSLTPISQGEGPAGATTNFEFSVTLDAAVQGGFTLAYTTNDGTATVADGDYLDNDGTLTFAGTAGEIQTISVLVNGDDKIEADETFSVVLGDFGGLAAGVDANRLSVAGSPQTATIQDGDSDALSITGSLIQAEGSGGGATDFVFTVTLNKAVQDGFTVAYTTNDAGATAGEDYTDNDGSLTFAGTAGETQTITVQVQPDYKVEANEQFKVILGAVTPVSAPAASISTGDVGTGTITDDDIYMIFIDDLGSAEAPVINEESGTAVFTVRLGQADAGGSPQEVVAGQSVTVSFQTQDSSAQEGLDYTAASGNLTFGPGQSSQTVSVAILDRTYDNDPGAHDDPAVFAIALTNPSANAQLGDSVGYAYIADDDYTIYPSAGTGGTIDPSVPETVESGASSSVYDIGTTTCIRDIRDNGTSVFTPATDVTDCVHSDPASPCNHTTYQVTNVTADHTIIASFREVFTFQGLIEPEEVRTGAAAAYARWRLIDEVATVAAGHSVFVGGDADGWNLHGATVPLNCAHSTYTLQFKDVPSFYTPPDQYFEVPNTSTVNPVVRTGDYSGQLHTLTIHFSGGTGDESVSLDPPAGAEGGTNTFLFDASSTTVVNLTAYGAGDPNPSLFKRWEGDVSAPYDISTAVTMDASKTVTVYFEVPGVDADGDGYVSGTGPGEDCDDTNPAIHPDAPEICGNSVDEDCSGVADACTAADIDNDGDGYTENMGDCDDSNAAINPGATEICGNSVDEDCYDGPRDCGIEVTCVDYAEIPLETQAQTAPPNVMFVLDDSGSMTWSFMTRQNDGIFNGYYNIFSLSDDAWTALPSTYRRRWKSQWSGYNRIYYNPGTEYVPWPRWNTYATGTPPLNANIDNPRSKPTSATPTLDLNATFMTITVVPPENQRLTVRRQGSDMGSSTAADAIGLHPAASGPLGSGATPSIAVDNLNSGAAGQPGTFVSVGTWDESGSPNEYLGSCYYNSASSGASATWTPNIATAGYYRVYAWVNTYTGRDHQADYTIYHANGGDGETEYTVLMDQGGQGGKWYQLNRSGETDSLFYFNNQAVTAASVDIRNSHYFTWKDLDTDNTVDPGEVFLINLSGSGTTGTIDYYRFTDTDAVDTNDTSTSQDDVDNGELSLLTEDQARTLGIIPVDGEGNEQTYAQVRQNFANWFTFYRRRELTAKAAIGRVIDDVNAMNVGLYGINGNIKEPVKPIGLAVPVVKIIDNGDAAYTESGSWSNSSSTSPYDGDARYTGTSGSYATYTPTFSTAEAGSFRVWAWWNCYDQRDENAKFTIVHADGTDTVYKNQRQGGSDGCGKWVLLGQYTFDDGSAGYVRVARHAGSNGSSTAADAVKFEGTGAGTLADQSDYLLEKLYTTISNGSTPLRRGVEDVGQYYDADDGNTGNLSATAPWAEEAFGGGCQKAFAIVMTDGYYNGSDPAVGNADSDGNTDYDGGIFAGGGSDNLADVTMKYYEEDLNNGLSNEVRDHNYDIAPHQHMTTFTVAFGVTGNINPADYPNCLPDAKPGEVSPVCPNWPADPENGSDRDKIDDLYHAAVNGRGKFLSAANPDELVAALNEIMADIDDSTGSGASVSVNAQELQEGTLLFQATYTTGSWHGDLVAKELDQYTGLIKSTKWSAGEKLAARSWNDRNIVTYNGSDGRQFRFQVGLLDQLTTAQKQALLDTTSDPLTLDEQGELSKLVAYLRGDNTYAGENDDYRLRGGPLGDLVHSAPLHFNNVIFVGGNDGMLHAFDDGSVTAADGGKEIFAYVPNLVIPNLRHLANHTYTHKYYVDNDVYATTVDVSGTSKSLLVGTLGRGGKGLYCLDITSLSFASEADAAGAVPLWEYPDADSPASGDFTGATPGSDPDMGYTFSKAYIVDSQVGLVVITGNGYGSDNGTAVLYVFNALNGNLIRKIDTGTGDASANCNGLSTPTLIDPDMDGKVDYVYAGDLLGNMWKFDLTAASATDWKVAYNTLPDHTGTPQPLIQVKNAVKTGTSSYLQHRQPITTKPAIVSHCDPAKAGYLVIFGTGRYLGNNDFGDDSLQSLYGIWDWGPEWVARGTSPVNLSYGYLMAPVAAPAYGFLEYDGGTEPFTTGELVTGHDSNAYGTIKAIDGDTASGTLELVNLVGTFQNNETLIGNIGGEAEAFGTAVVQPARYLSNIYGHTGLSGDAKYVSLLRQHQTLFINDYRVISQNPIRWFDIAARDSGANEHVGWYLDLPTSNERMIRIPTVRGMVAYIITSIPSNSPCASGGLSIIHALDACTGGRTITAQFDISGPDGVPDGVIDAHDLINIAPPGQDPIYVPPSGLLRNSMWYTPSILGLNQNVDIMYFSTSDGGIETLNVAGEQVGMCYWREIYGN